MRKMVKRIIIWCFLIFTTYLLYIFKPDAYWNKVKFLRTSQQKIDSRVSRARANSSEPPRPPQISRPSPQDLPCRAAFEGRLGPGRGPSPRVTLARCRRGFTPDQLLSEIGGGVGGGGGCRAFRRRFGYEGLLPAPTPDERAFPLAVGFLVYRNVAQFERLVRLVYRPHNFHCVHVDAAAAPSFRASVAALARCLPNFIVASKSYRVRWGKDSLTLATLQCMRDLLKLPANGTAWRYFLHYTGEELPLKTNRELVRILTAYRGYNDILHGFESSFNQYRFESKEVLDTALAEVPGCAWFAEQRARKGAPPHNITYWKASTFGLLTRDFVDFVVNGRASRDYWRWLRGMRVTDEAYWGTLSVNMQLNPPGGSPRVHAPAWESQRPVVSVTRDIVWKDGAPCHGRWRRNVCVRGLLDLNRLRALPAVAANKFYSADTSNTSGNLCAAFDCTEEYMWRRTIGRFPSFPLGTTGEAAPDGRAHDGSRAGGSSETLDGDWVVHELDDFSFYDSVRETLDEQMALFKKYGSYKSPC